MLRGAKRRGNPFPARHRRADGTSGTPSPTERFDALRAGRDSEFKSARGIPKRKTTQRVVFLYFSRSAQQNRRGSNSLPGIPRMAEPFAGALPSPLDLTRFAPVKAASSSLPAAFQKETPSCRMVFLYFSRSAQQNRRGSNSLPGIPRMAEPFAGALPLPLDLTRFALVEAASPILPATFQKEKPPKGWFFFLERATRLELATSTLARSRSTR